MVIENRTNVNKWTPKFKMSQENLKKKHIISTKKIMTFVFWYHKNIILIEYLSQVETIITERSWETKEWKMSFRLKKGTY